MSNDEVGSEDAYVTFTVKNDRITALDNGMSRIELGLTLNELIGIILPGYELKGKE